MKRILFILTIFCTTAAIAQGGPVTTTAPDGTMTTSYPDGSSIAIAPDGTKTEVLRDGSKIITTPDGKQTKIPAPAATTPAATTTEEPPKEKSSEPTEPKVEEEPKSPPKEEVPEPDMPDEPDKVKANVKALPTAMRNQNSRTLNGHTFNSSDLVNDPFNPTYFALEMGTGRGSVEQGGSDVTVGGMQQRLSGQLHLMKGFSVATTYGGETVFNNSSGLGLSTNFGHWLNAKYGFDLTPSVRAAFSADGYIQTTGMLKGITEKAYGLSGQIAWGSGILGAYADLGAGYATEVEAVYFDAGVGVSLDLGPVGVLGTYKIDSSFQDETQYVHKYGVAGNVTVGQNFFFGLELQRQSIKAQDLGLTSLIFRMRYYWDADREYDESELKRVKEQREEIEVQNNAAKVEADQANAAAAEQHEKAKAEAKAEHEKAKAEAEKAATPQ